MDGITRACEGSAERLGAGRGRRLLLALAAMCLCSYPAGGQGVVAPTQGSDPGAAALVKAAKEMDAGNVQAALPKLFEAANHGSAEAKFYLGEFYETGTAVEASRERALQWYQQAALAGVPHAMSSVGGLYVSGIDGVPDMKAGVYWLEKARGAKEANGTLLLASLYCVGKGIARDLARCAALADEAAADLTPADTANGVRAEAERFALGVGQGFETGKDYPKEAREADAWYERAAALGDADGVLARAALASSDGSAAGSARAFGLLKELAAQREAFGPERQPISWGQLNGLQNQLTALSATYQEAEGTAVEPAIAVDLLLMELGLSNQGLALAGRYAAGERVPLSVAHAEELLGGVKDVAKLDDTQQRAYWKAEKELAGDYLAGTGTAKDEARALQLYEGVIGSGDGGTAVMLAGRYARGDGLPLHPEEGERLLGKAQVSDLPWDDQQEYHRVETALAEDYMEGRGTAKSVSKALKLYRSAAEGGEQSSSIALGLLYAEGKVVPFNAEKASSYLELQHSLYLGPPRPPRPPGHGTLDLTDGMTDLDKHRYALGARLLGDRYARGDGVKANRFSARRWYERAADAGDTVAEARLAALGPPPPPAPRMIVNPPRSVALGRPVSVPPPIQSRAPVMAASAAPRSSAPAGAEKPAPVPQVEERYPNIEAPEVVHPGNAFSVLISLTGEQIAPETVIKDGAQDNGKLVIPMPEGIDSIHLEVNLTAPGMEFLDGSNIGGVELERGKDSTVAQFHLRVRDGAALKPTKLMATFWYNSGYLARVERPIEISAAVPSDGRAVMKSAAAAPAPMAAPAQAPMAALSTKAKVGPPGRAGIALEPSRMAPDFTIEEEHIGDTVHLSFRSPYFHNTVVAEVDKEAELREYLRGRFASLARHGRGITVEPSATSALHGEDEARAFGDELFARYAPAEFKRLYWQLADGQTPIRTLEIVSNDPVLPWELMRPVREDGTDRQDFLALTTRVTRWQVSSHGLPNPPQALRMQRMVVIAPHYAGAMALQGAQSEANGLETYVGVERVKGDYQTVRNLAGDLPEGIVHFAGHGAVTGGKGAEQFVIELEDSELSSSTWEALVKQGQVHPFYFFNACEVGQAQQAVNALDGWAPALLESGASGYLGALWPVSDAVAGSFAANFYKILGANPTASVAEIVRQTRQQTYEQTHDTTSLAYVLYADPWLEIRR